MITTAPLLPTVLSTCPSQDAVKPAMGDFFLEEQDAMRAEKKKQKQSWLHTLAHIYTCAGTYMYTHSLPRIHMNPQV